MKAQTEGAKAGDLSSGAIFPEAVFAGTREKAAGLSGLFTHITDNIRADDGSPQRVLGGFFGAWALLFLFLFVIPLPDITGSDGTITALSSQGRACLAVMVWACTIWLTEAIPISMTGLMIPALLALTGAVKHIKHAAVAFSQPVALLCLAAFIFAALMMVSGIDRRVAVGLMKRAKIKRVGGVIWTLFGFNILLSLILPAANARAATMLPVVNGVLGLFGETPEERKAKKAVVIQSIVYGAMISGIMIMTAHVPNLIVVGLLNTQLKISVSYIDWFILQVPYIGMFVLTNWWVNSQLKTNRIAIPGGRERILKMSDQIPPMTWQDIIILGVFVLVSLLWITQRTLHNLHTAMAILIGIMVMFSPGLLSMKWKQVQDRTIWGTWVMLCGALSMSNVMGSSGLADWLAAFIHPMVEGHSWWMMLLLILTGTQMIRIGMLSNIAAITVLAPILMALAPKLNLNAAAFTMLVANADTFAYLIPTQLTAAVIAYGTGTFTMRDYFKLGWMSVLIAIAYTILVMVPWYAFLGIPIWDPASPWPF
jgi:solute carrier family 13 (sodium-dependent dicarboxylate transporter), member 2/3/5